MNCKYCGTALPPDAMFCGECGRSVVVTAARIAANAQPAPPAPAGFVLSKPVEPEPEFLNITIPPGLYTSSNDTAVIEPVELAAVEEVVAAVAEPEPVVESIAGPDPERDAEDELFDLEATRISRGAAVGVRFVLQFSTGESQAVFGTGIIGRNPVAEPGEYFDQRIAISDPGKSVSKTHLEFGQTASEFWISDRYSGNGTVVRQPEAPASRCEPGRRYIVPRGARIDIGEQFFVVS